MEKNTLNILILLSLMVFVMVLFLHWTILTIKLIVKKIIKPNFSRSNFNFKAKKELSMIQKLKNLKVEQEVFVRSLKVGLMKFSRLPTTSQDLMLQLKVQAVVLPQEIIWCNVKLTLMLNSLCQK